MQGSTQHPFQESRVTLEAEHLNRTMAPGGLTPELRRQVRRRQAQKSEEQRAAESPNFCSTVASQKGPTKAMREKMLE